MVKFIEIQTYETRPAGDSVIKIPARDEKGHTIYVESSIEKINPCAILDIRKANNGWINAPGYTWIDMPNETLTIKNEDLKLLVKKND